MSQNTYMILFQQKTSEAAEAGIATDRRHDSQATSDIITVPQGGRGVRMSRAMVLPFFLPPPGMIQSSHPAVGGADDEAKTKRRKQYI